MAFLVSKMGLTVLFNWFLFQQQSCVTLNVKISCSSTSGTIFSKCTILRFRYLFSASGYSINSLLRDNKNDTTDLQKLYFAKIISADNFQDITRHFRLKTLSKLVNQTRYNTFPSKKWYFLTLLNEQVCSCYLETS